MKFIGGSIRHGKMRKQEFIVKLENEIHENPYTSGSYTHDSQTLKKKVLNGIQVKKCSNWNSII